MCIRDSTIYNKFSVCFDFENGILYFGKYCFFGLGVETPVRTQSNWSIGQSNSIEYLHFFQLWSSSIVRSISSIEFDRFDRSVWLSSIGFDWFDSQSNSIVFDWHPLDQFNNKNIQSWEVISFTLQWFVFYLLLVVFELHALARNFLLHTTMLHPSNLKGRMSAAKQFSCQEWSWSRLSCTLCNHVPCGSSGIELNWGVCLESFWTLQLLHSSNLEYSSALNWITWHLAQQACCHVILNYGCEHTFFPISQVVWIEIYCLCLEPDFLLFSMYTGSDISLSFFEVSKVLVFSDNSNTFLECQLFF